MYMYVYIYIYMVTPHDLPRNILYGNYHVVLHMYIYIYMTRILTTIPGFFLWMTHWDLMLIGFPRSI